MVDCLRWALGLGADGAGVVVDGGWRARRLGWGGWCRCGRLCWIVRVRNLDRLAASRGHARLVLSVVAPGLAGRMVNDG